MTVIHLVKAVFMCDVGHNYKNEQMQHVRIHYL